MVRSSASLDLKKRSDVEEGKIVPPPPQKKKKKRKKKENGNRKTCPKHFTYKAILRQTFFLRSQSEHFPFLGTHTTRAYKDMRSRTTFYIALGRLLMVDLGEDEDKFESFMAPITSKHFPTLALSVIIVTIFLA